MPVLQYGVEPEQSSSDVQTKQVPVLTLQFGVEPEQCASDVQATQALVLVLQYGVEPEQFALDVQAKQMPVLVLQFGFEEMASLHCSLAVHALQTFVTESQMGAAANKEAQDVVSHSS